MLAHICINVDYLHVNCIGGMLLNLLSIQLTFSSASCRQSISVWSC